MSIQGVSDYLILAYPRSVSTAFTRALCKATGRSGVHESLISKYDPSVLGVTQEGEKIKTVKEDLRIYKEMFANTAFVNQGYKKELAEKIRSSRQPIIFITANPLEVVYSILNIELEEKLEKPYRYANDRIILQDISAACHDAESCVKEKYLISRMCREEGIDFLEITKDEILDDPFAAANTVLVAWGETPLSDQTKPVELADAVNLYETYRQGNYHLTYIDSWTGEEDQSKTVLEPKERPLNDEEQTRRSDEKIMELIMTQTAKNVSPALYTQADIINITRSNLNILYKKLAFLKRQDKTGTDQAHGETTG